MLQVFKLRIVTLWGQGLYIELLAYIIKSDSADFILAQIRVKL